MFVTITRIGSLVLTAKACIRERERRRLEEVVKTAALAQQ